MMRADAAGHIAMAGCFALFFGFHYFGPTFIFGPMDCTHFAFILVSLLVPLAGMRPLGLAVFASLYGSLIAIFEFLTGGIPLALSILPLLLALGFRQDRRSYFAKLMILWGSFCLAVIVSFALKKHLAILVLGDTMPFLDLLFVRMYGGNLGVSAASNPLDVVIHLMKSYYEYSRIIAWGSSRLGAYLVIAALGAILIVTVRNRRTLWSFDRPMRPAALLSLGALSAWVVVFLQHTMIHPFFQARLLVVPILAAATLVVTEIFARGAQAPALRHV